MIKNFYRTITAATLLASSGLAHATIVEIKTNLGSFEVNLFDKSTPVTVENFLNYTNAEQYHNTVIHRSMPGFVIQGGGFVFEQELPLKQTETNAAIVNEPKWSNVRGTIAMAKLSGNPNSATNQWFINLTDNSANLDFQNGGFTVFGQINAQGMEVVDAIAALPRYNFQGVTTDLPLTNYTSDDYSDNKPLVASNFIVVESITVVDETPNTEVNATKTPTRNEQPDTIIGGSAGSAGLVSLLALMLVAIRRRITH